MAEPSRRERVARIASAGLLPTDTEDERLRKATLTLAPLLVIPMASVWVVTYWLFRLPLSAAIPFAYQVVSAVSLLLFLRTKRYRAFRFIQLLLMLLLPFLLQLSLGGFVASSGVILWSLVSPLGALMFSGRAQGVRWLAAFLALTAVAAAVDPALPDRASEIPGGVVVAFFALNFIGVSAVCFVLLHYFVRERERAKERSERLLLNVLPAPIAARLKVAERAIADGFEEATVLFADIEGFTRLSERLSPGRVVEILDGIFSAFDELAKEHGLEKIKTIGDAYMVAGGIPISRPNHAEAVADMALAMLERCRELDADLRLALRIGMDTGPVVAGVIGRSKFIYDLWGDTVNTASRMESHGIPGHIQVTERTYRRLRDDFLFRSRGTVEVKGKGPMATYLLLGRLS
jgi:adenylate cyclase